MADAIPVSRQSPKNAKIAAPANGVAVAGLMSPNSDEVIPPTNYMEPGRLADEGDLGAIKATSDVVQEVRLVPEKDGTVPVLTHRATRVDH
jgi:hypothetical protein